MLTARLFSILLFLCYHLTSTNAIYTDNVFCVPLAHRQMPTIASCYAAIDSMSSNTLAVQYAPGLRLGVSSGDCQIHIQQILGTPAYHPTMGHVASTEHILWRFVKWKATDRAELFRRTEHERRHVNSCWLPSGNDGHVPDCY